MIRFTFYHFHSFLSIAFEKREKKRKRAKRENRKIVYVLRLKAFGFFFFFFAVLPQTNCHILICGLSRQVNSDSSTLLWCIYLVFFHSLNRFGFGWSVVHLLLCRILLYRICPKATTWLLKWFIVRFFKRSNIE